MALVMTLYVVFVFSSPICRWPRNCLLEMIM
uniref:Uncharacterized protein n=1 Tax=Anguilla anguilla TaxID=7936 RepID=A0A0E9VCJ3_ANGAN